MTSTVSLARHSDLDVASVLARAESFHALIREHAAQGEQERRVPNETMRALIDAGVFRLGQPARYGGAQADIRSTIELSGIVGEADGSTAWLVAIHNLLAFLVGFYGEEAQHDVWGDNPEALVGGVFAPTATTTRASGGYVLSGEWHFNSGAWDADWFTLGAPITDSSGQVVDQGIALVPRAEIRHKENWFVAGMSATGSNCVIAESVFVPDHRMLSVMQVFGPGGNPAFPDETLYRAAMVPMGLLSICGPQLGMGRAALKLVMEKSQSKPLSYTVFETQAASTGFQIEVAEAAILIDTAHLHVWRAAADLQASVDNDTMLDIVSRARIRADCAHAIRSVTRGIDMLLSAHGAGSFASANPLQRLWRDSAVGARHAWAVPSVAVESYGKALLGRDDHITSFL
jgi:alkylation response protein AidB-like acyl-CoA dehydrogenase